jgi:tryptophanyl-tRNA synthetase
MRALSGIQPSGKLHLGNYFGMMKPALELQEKAECFYFIANYHAMTTVQDADRLRESTQDVAIDFLTCGLDPARTVFYRQSDVPEVTELTWLLSVVEPVSRMELAHSYKDKVAHGVKPNMGLFSYPMLMAADILAVDSDIVPVGRDQQQHVEIARDVAGRFNQQYGEVLKLPNAVIRDEVAVVPGIDGQKMSKSYGNTIEIFGDPNETRARIMRIVTDSKSVQDAKDPDTCNVFALFKLFATDAQREEMAARYRAGGMGYGEAKKALHALFEEQFGPLRTKRAELAKDRDHVESILRSGAERAGAVIRATLKRARKAVGLE